MPLRFQMGDVVTRCQRRADKEGDNHISTAEWYALVDETYRELHGTVVQSGMRYFESTTTITANGSSTGYLEPSDHFETIGIARIVNATTGEREDLAPIEIQDVSRYAGKTGEAYLYAHIDDRLYLFPAPVTGSYLWLYAPHAPDLTQYAGTDVVDVVSPAGLAFLTWGVAATALSKSASATDDAITEREQARVRFEEECSLKMLTSGHRRVVRGSPWRTDYDPADWRWSR